jgi:hypothetical protein
MSVKREPGRPVEPSFRKTLVTGPGLDCSKSNPGRGTCPPPTHWLRRRHPELRHRTGVVAGLAGETPDHESGRRDEWMASITIPYQVKGTRDRPSGGDPHGDGVPIVVSGRESRPHGEGGQVASLASAGRYARCGTPKPCWAASRTVVQCHDDLHAGRLDGRPKKGY